MQCCCKICGNLLFIGKFVGEIRIKGKCGHFNNIIATDKSIVVVGHDVRKYEKKSFAELEPEGY